MAPNIFCCLYLRNEDASVSHVFYVCYTMLNLTSCLGKIRFQQRKPSIYIIANVT
jgi:hypothetical protein